MESMIRQSEAGRSMSIEDVHRELRQYVSHVLCCRRFLPKQAGERVRYRLVEVLELGETADADRMVSA